MKGYVDTKEKISVDQMEQSLSHAGGDIFDLRPAGSFDLAHRNVFIIRNIYNLQLFYVFF